MVRFLAVSFPYSDMRCCVALSGETAKCVCQGLLDVFERVGMASGVLVFDNVVGVGCRDTDGTVTMSRLFSLFCAHHGFDAGFCNPYSGHGRAV